MDITEKMPAVRCTICKRLKETARDEQIEKQETCGIGYCYFHSYISEAIRELQRLVLLSFEVSEDQILEGETIRVSWQTRNCKRAYIVGYGEVEPSGTAEFPVTRKIKAIEINLTNLFDEVFEYKKKITVRGKPRIKIIDCKEKILIGERSLLHYKATNARAVFLRDSTGETIGDLSGENYFTTAPISRNTRFTLHATGKYGGEAVKEINIEVFKPPVINYFRSNVSETIDSLTIPFEFSYKNAYKAEILCNDISIADVSGKRSYVHRAENKNRDIIFPKFELVITSPTGAVVMTGLEGGISISPQPSIESIAPKPESVVLYPTAVTFVSRTLFTEKILFSYGTKDVETAPTTQIRLTPSSSQEFFFTPIGRQNFYGKREKVFIEVVHPVEIEASTDKKVTLPNLPVTISWRSKNHSKIVIDPGNIDVTNRTSYKLKLDETTRIKVTGMNKKHIKSVEIPIDVLSYPRFDQKIFADLPKLDAHVAGLNRFTAIPGLKELKRSPPERKVINFRVLSTAKISDLSSEILKAFRKILPKIDLNLHRSLRRKIFAEMRSEKKIKNIV